MDTNNPRHPRQSPEQTVGLSPAVRKNDLKLVALSDASLPSFLMQTAYLPETFSLALIASIQVPLELLVLFADAMRLIPVQFRTPHITRGRANQGLAGRQQ